MRRTHALAPALLLVASGLHAQPAPDASALTHLLEEFLSGASRNDAAIHQRFWAEDLIYTGSAGRRIGKADIMDGLRAPASTPGPSTAYRAEDVRIHQYGDTAVVAFRLIGTTDVRGKPSIMSFFNTGTFLERDGVWRAVAWQATRIPPSADEARREVEEANGAFHGAVLAADVETLESVADEGFVWTYDTGEQVTRQQLADQIRSGERRYSRIETSPVTVAVHGETAMARGVSLRQRAGEAEPFRSSYTFTFVREGGAWKAVALHTSRTR
jgi:ketosteroid isomerase-like protein